MPPHSPKIQNQTVNVNLRDKKIFSLPSGREKNKRNYKMKLLKICLNCKYCIFGEDFTNSFICKKNMEETKIGCKACTDWELDMYLQSQIRIINNEYIIIP